MRPAPSSSAAAAYKPVAASGSSSSNSAWLQWSINGVVAGTMTFDLNIAAAPRTCASFLALCTGEAGVSAATRTRLHYKGCPAHRLIPSFMIQCGDIGPRNDGTGGESIYGANFADEAGGLKQRHSARGVLAMANSGPNTNSSQFYITFAPTPWLDGKHVVFGRLVEGEAVLDAIERVVTSAGDRPRVPVVISDCGVGAAPADGRSGGGDAAAAEEASRVEFLTAEELGVGGGTAHFARSLKDAGLPTAFAARKRPRSTDTAAAPAVVASVVPPALRMAAALPVSVAVPAQRAIELSPAADGDDAAGTLPVGLSGELKDRLFALRMKMNAGRKANTAQIAAEHRRLLAAERRADPTLREANGVLQTAPGAAAPKPAALGGAAPEDPLLRLVPVESRLATAAGAGGGGGGESGRREPPPADANDDGAAAGSDSAPPPPAMAPAYMFESAEAAQARRGKAEARERVQLTSYGYTDASEHHTEVLARAHERRMAALLGSGGGSGMPAISDVDGAAASIDRDYVNPAGAATLAASLVAEDERRMRDVRRRSAASGSGQTSYISESNRRFVEKAEKQLGKYTTEFKAAVERGSAV